MDTETETETTARKEMVCIGTRVWNGKDRVQVWQEVLPDDTLGEEKGYSKAVVAANRGQVFTWTRNTEGKIFISGPRAPKYKGLYPDARKRLEWQIAHEAAECILREEQRRKKDAEENLLRDVLEPIRAKYRKALTAERRAILASVMEYLTR